MQKKPFSYFEASYQFPKSHKNNYYPDWLFYGTTTTTTKTKDGKTKDGTKIMGNITTITETKNGTTTTTIITKRASKHSNSSQFFALNADCGAAVDFFSSSFNINDSSNQELFIFGQCKHTSKGSTIWQSNITDTQKEFNEKVQDVLQSICSKKGKEFKYILGFYTNRLCETEKEEEKIKINELHPNYFLVSRENFVDYFTPTFAYRFLDEDIVF